MEAARILSSVKPQISFLLVGTGADYENISTSVDKYKLSNVILLGQQPREDIPDYLRLCDVSLIILRNTEVFSTVIPSKLFECMGVGISVLTSVPDGELTKIVNERQCGECIEPESPELLAATIQSMVENPERLATQRDNSLAAADYYSRDRLAHKMLDIIKETEQKNDSVIK